MLYFRDEIRAETWEYGALAAWAVLLNIFVSSLKRCTSSDVENKHLFKAGANADAGGRKFYVAEGRNDERFRAGGSSGIQRRNKDARPARSYTCILSRKPRPTQRGRDYEQSVTKTAAVVTRCVFLLPLGGSSRRNKQDKEYRSALGLHKVVSQLFRGSVQ